MTLRSRVAVVLVACAVIGLELALMRILSLRFWYYFAAMVISVALLGFGFSGTLLTLAQRLLAGRHHIWLAAGVVFILLPKPSSPSQPSTAP